ncbi:MAG: fibronectin type III domain-containing protein [Bacteroidota bacterium]
MKVLIYGCFLVLLLCPDNVFALVERLRCTWSEDPATTMTIGWDQVSGKHPVVFYDYVDFGSDVSKYTFKHEADHWVYFRGMNNVFARLEGLLPNTKYYFMIVDSEGTSRQYSFTTLPDNPHERLSIIAGGDSRNNRDSRQNANQLVAKLKPHFVMFAGDMTGGDINPQWRNWFDDWQLTISADGHITPIIPARGNHEDSNETIVNLFDAPSPEVYYGLTFGGYLLRVYTLNSMMAAGGDQADWLERDLSSNTHVIWQFAQYHHPIRPHTAGKSEKEMQWQHWAPKFFKYGVDVVVECDAHMVKSTWPIRPFSGKGHEEGFIRDDENGTIYIGEGCWGAPLRPNNDDKSWTRASGSFNQFKWIFVDEQKIEIRTIKTDNANQVGEVYEPDIFYPPYNLDIWQPPTGSLIERFNPNYIPPKPPPVVEEIATPVYTNALKNVELSLLKSKSVKVDLLVLNESVELTFEIQRSANGIFFKTIDTLRSESPSGMIKTLEAIDDEVIFVNVPEAYYRVKYYSKKTPEPLFSEVVKTKIPSWNDYEIIEAHDESKLVKVWYQLDNSQDVTLSIYNSSGLQMLSKRYEEQEKGDYMRVLNLRNWTPGTYLMHLRTGAGEVIKRILVPK